MNISIFAAIWCKNLWDELILKNEIEILEKKYKKEEQFPRFRVFSYAPKKPFFQKENVEYVEYFPNGSRLGNRKKNLKNYLQFLKTIFWSDLIVIGGGGLFYDGEVQVSDKSLDLWLLRMKHFRFFRKKVVFYAVGVDVKNKQNLAKIRRIFSGAEKVYVRDETSRRILFENKIASHEIDDPVFHDNPLYNHKKSQFIKLLHSKTFSLKELSDIDVEGKRIGVAFRAGYLSGANNEEIEVAKLWEMIHFLVGKWAKKIIFLPHSIHPTDTSANDYHFLKQFVSTKVDVVDTIEEVYTYYTEQKMDICFAMRLHSIILSQVYHIPYVAFSYSQKTIEAIKKITR